MFLAPSQAVHGSPASRQHQEQRKGASSHWAFLCLSNASVPCSGMTQDCLYLVAIRFGDWHLFQFRQPMPKFGCTGVVRAAGLQASIGGDPVCGTWPVLDDETDVSEDQRLAEFVTRFVHCFWIAQDGASCLERLHRRRLMPRF